MTETSPRRRTEIDADLLRRAAAAAAKTGSQTPPPGYRVVSPAERAAILAARNATTPTAPKAETPVAPPKAVEPAPPPAPPSAPAAATEARKSHRGRNVLACISAAAVAAAATGVIYHQVEHRWPWEKQRATSRTVGQQLPAHKTPTAVKPSASTGRIIPLPTSPSASATPNPAASCTTLALKPFTPETIPTSDWVNGTVTGLKIPFNYVYKPDAKSTTQYTLTDAVGVQVDGTLGISGTANVTSNPNQSAIVPDADLSTQKGASVVRIYAGRLTTMLSMRGLRFRTLSPPLTGATPLEQGTALSQFFGSHFSPALPTPLTADKALDLYHQLLGDPAATTQAAQLGQKPTLIQNGQAALVGVLQQPQNAVQIASAFQQVLVPKVVAQEQAACIPTSNIADVAAYSDFKTIPDMSSQYPPVSGATALSVDTAHIYQHPAQPASAGAAAVPATITFNAIGSN